MNISFLLRRWACVLLAIALVAGCGDATSPNRIVFDVERVPMIAVTTDIYYRYSIRNTSERAIYLPTCDNTVQLGFNILGPGASRDAISTICLSVFPAVLRVLEPGESYSGAGVITPVADAQLQPILFFSLSPDRSAEQSVTAPIL